MVLSVMRNKKQLWWKLAAKWRICLTKRLWIDLIIFLMAFYMISFVYRTLMNDSQKMIFETYFNFFKVHNFDGLESMLIGFYVPFIVCRWWIQYSSMPWPDGIANYLNAIIKGHDEHGRALRRTIVRYVCLSHAMALVETFPGLRERFNSLDEFVRTGLLLESETFSINRLKSRFPHKPKHWMPIVWATSLMARARAESRIRDNESLNILIGEIQKFRENCENLLGHDKIYTPPIIKYVMYILTLGYTFTVIMSSQVVTQSNIDWSYHEIYTIYIPILAIMRFLFFFGWLRVTDNLLVPYDDEDYELDNIIERNLEVSYQIVDEINENSNLGLALGMNKGMSEYELVYAAAKHFKMDNKEFLEEYFPKNDFHDIPSTSSNSYNTIYKGTNTLYSAEDDDNDF